MAEMTPKERGRTLSETLLSDIEKTADVQVAARWLINNADEQIRQAVQAEREKLTASCERYTDKCVDQEREACAKEAETYPLWRDHWEFRLMKNIATNIRARGEKDE